MKTAHLKKFISIVLVLVIAFSITVPAMALDTERPFLATKNLSNILISEASMQNETLADEDTTEDETEEVDPAIAYKNEVLRLLNIERAKVGAGALTSLDILNTMADVRAMESASYFSHTRPDGTRCFTVFSQYNVRYRYAGENLAFGFSTPQKVITAWMNSPSHKENMLNPKYANIGIGYFMKSDGKVYCSLLLFTRRKQPNE